MPRITLVELHGYREWTESLGYDREWVIQEKQARLYSLLQRSFSKKGGFVLPIRYDYFIVLSNNIDLFSHQAIYLSFEGESPVPVRMASVAHPYPFMAQLEATRLLARSMRDLIYVEGAEDPVVAVHIDYDNIRSFTYETSVYEAYMRVSQIYSYLIGVTQRHGGIAAYLGGDNIIAILPRSTYREYLSILPRTLKAGVGISMVPRRALELAARALSELRARRGFRSLVYADEAPR